MAERLETRAMMAADWFASDFWNGTRPEDVNADQSVSPIDALLIINELNKTGSRPLMGVTQASTEGGEGESNEGDKFFYDVNNDGHLSPIDSLLVINALNAEGEGELMKYQIYAVPVGAAFSPANQLASVPKGTEFDLVITVQDLRSGSQRGVSAGFIDVLYDTDLASVYVNEIQHVILTGAPTDGSFTLSFGGQTTDPIVWSDQVDPSTTIADDIDAKLEELSTIGAGNVIVTYEPIGDDNAWQVRFVNALGDQDLEALQGNGSGLTGGTDPDVFINETGDGVPSDPFAFREAFRSLPPGNPRFYQGNLNAGNLPDRIDDVGGAYLNPFPPFPGKVERELVRARMNAEDAGTIVFTPSVASIVHPAHQTLLYDRNPPLVPAEISFGTGAVSLVITELVSANPDIVTIAEDSGANAFNPIAGVPGGSQANGLDVKNPGANAADLRITAVNGQTSGTIVLPSLATVTFSGSTTSPSISYTPAPNFVGQDVFEYTISDTVNFDTATVTVNVTGVNDAPHNLLNNADITGATPARIAAEDTPFVFNAANSSVLSISDVDAGATTNNLVNLTVNNGTLTLANTSGLTFSGGANGTNNMSFTGSLASINAALNGMVFTPTTNFSGNATLTITTNDNGNTGSGPVVPDSDSITINVAAANDGPQNTVPPAQTVDEFPDVLTFSTANGNRISVADVDAGGASNFEVTLGVNNGKLKLFQTTGLTFFSGADNSAAMGIRGTLANINAALDGMTYTGNDLPVPFVGNDILTIVSNDKGNTGTGGEKFDSDTVSIQVIATVRPRAVPDNFPLNEGPGPFQLDVKFNDLAHMGAFFTTLLSVTQPAAGRGTVQIVDPQTGTTLDADLTDDQVLYTPPDPNFFGTVTFTYTINDNYVVGVNGPGPDDNSTATVTLVIAGSNDAPTAVNDPGFSTAEDTPLTTLLAQSVLNNDTDPDNQFDVDGDGDIDVTDALAAIIEVNPSNGSVTLNLDGTFTYTPNANYNGLDSFTYRVRDSANATSANTATVSINVTAVNDKPIGGPDNYTIAEDGTLTANGTLPNPNGVLFNDADGDPELSQPLTVDMGSVTQPVDGTNTPRGTLVMDPSANGSFTYTPPANFFGTVTFQYRASDGQAQNPLSDLTTVTINVTPVNDAPVVTDDSYTTTEDTPVIANGATPTRRGVLFNDTDVDSSGLGVNFPLIDEPDNGTLVINDNGTFTYTPDEDFFGTDTFQYRATDGFATSSTGGTLNDGVATVTIEVIAVGDPPVANPDSYTTDEDTTLVVDDSSPTRRSVLFNDSDPDSPFTVLASSVTQPVDGTNTPRGTLAMDPNGVFVYTPPAEFSGVVTFQYRATDGGPTPSNLTTVQITIAETNDPPDAVDDEFTAIKDFVNQEIDVLSNDDFAPDVNETLKVIAVQGVAADANGDTPAQPTSVPGGSVRLDNFVVLYNSPPGHVGADSFTYTITDGRTVNPLTDTATVNVDVLAFVPKIIAGTVFSDVDGDGQIYGGDSFTDTNSNGVYDGDGRFVDGNFVGEPFALGQGPRSDFYDPPERRISGVTIQLFGTDFQTNEVGTEEDPIEVVTDENGNYQFLGDASTQFQGLKPGTYTVREVQPAFLADGAEIENSPLASPAGENQFQVSWGPEDFSGNVSGLNFAEGGYNMNPATGGMTPTGGMVQESLLASSRRNGLIIATDMQGDTVWTWAMPGWNNLDRVELILDADEASATLRVWDTNPLSNGPVEIRIHQVATENGPTDQGLNTPPAGSLARFRVLGRGVDGNLLIRLDGTAAEFGLNLLAAAPLVGEGEAEGEANFDREYANAVDALMAEEAWA